MKAARFGVVLFSLALAFGQQSSGPAGLARYGLRGGAPSAAQDGASEGVTLSSTTPRWSTNYAFTPDTGLSLHTAVFDPSMKVMVVFGGIDWGAHETATNAVLLNAPANANGSWTTLLANGAAGSPPARAGHSAVYDITNNRMTVFGGVTCLACDNPNYLNDVWVLTNANGQGGTAAWTQLSPSGTPPEPRWGHVVAYDSRHNRMIVFGGLGSVNYSDVWVLSHANGLGGNPRWTQLAPSGSPATGVGLASAVYDQANNIFTVFGGEDIDETGFTNGVWTLAGANGLSGTPQWTNIVADSTPGSPAQRAGQSAVYDATNDRMIIFGGLAFSGTYAGTGFNDVWILSNANGLGGTPAWTQLKPSGTLPGTRSEQTAVYDAPTNRMMIFAGLNEDPVYYVVWVLSHANGL